jgi:hypothetical protein
LAAADGISVRIYASSFGVISLLGSSSDRSVSSRASSPTPSYFDTELLGHHPVPEQRQGAEQFSRRSAGDAGDIGREPGEDFARFDEHRRARGGKCSENLAA